MHRYLRAIGFSKINSRTDFEKILGIIMESPSSKHTLSIEHNHRLVQFNKDFLDNIGISVFGEYDERGFFYLNHSLPYAVSDIISAKESIIINNRIDTDAYTGMCDDIRLGVSLIFYLQNTLEYRMMDFSKHSNKIFDIYLSALSTEGKILLGLSYDKYKRDKEMDESIRHYKLIKEALHGSEEAINTLAIDEYDLKSAVSRRIKYEDIYSMVNTSFIPYGSESDNYTIIGTIMNFELITNTYTNERIYNLIINCNNIIFPVYINEADLVGEPMIGRRFKGNIWMQGHVDFDNI